MLFSRSAFVIQLTATLLLLLAPTINARCHNLSSTAFHHCSKHSDGAYEVVKAAATAPSPLIPSTTGQAKPQENLEAKFQAEALTANAPAAELPLSNGTNDSPTEDVKSLPPPSGTFKVTAWGTGTQNYTCPGPASPSATPTLIGAKAELYNADDPSRPLIGEHYFNAAGYPTFDLTAGGFGILQTLKTKAGDITAPTDAPGVDWLNLLSNGAYQDGLQEVYRVNTSNGKPAPGQCAGKPAGAVITSPYSAYYWFYS